MAIPPTIPTSFVPKQPVATQLRQQKTGVNVFMIIGASVAGISILLAGGVFAYEFYLKTTRDAKEAELSAAQKAVNIDTVEEYIRLRDRLNAVGTLLDQHVELSEFFDTLETRTLQSVRFSSLSVTVEDDRTAEIQMEGVARTFNALAAQSTEFASEKRIKRAIFSDISVNDNGTVGFSLTANLDPRLLTSGELLPGISDPIAPATNTPQPRAATSSPVSAPAAATTTPRATTTPAL